MSSRVCRTAFVAAFVLPSVLAVQSAYAGLGSAPMTPPADSSVSSRVVQPGTSATGAASAAVLRAAASGASSASAATSYTVRETTFGSGTVVREYLAADGSVFGLAWRGPQLPDLTDLLGSYFPQYVAGVKTIRAKRGGHGPVALDQSSLVVHSGGHMGAFAGQAWLPTALPAGVSGSDIQ